MKLDEILPVLIDCSLLPEKDGFPLVVLASVHSLSTVV
jgi:hypothetical protein